MKIIWRRFDLETVTRPRRAGFIHHQNTLEPRLSHGLASARKGGSRGHGSCRLGGREAVLFALQTGINIL